MKTNAITNQKGTIFTTKQMIIISMFAALSYALQLISLPYKHLGFLEFEFSDIPAVIASLQYGPFAGILIEFIKNLIKAITASTTAWVGEATNFLISCAFILPVSLLYKMKKSKGSISDKKDKSRVGELIYLVFIFAVAVITMTIAGALINYFVMIPLYAKAFGGMDSVIGFAASTVPAIKDLAGLVIIGITPFNIVKGITISVIGYYTYRLLRGRLL